MSPWFLAAAVIAVMVVCAGGYIAWDLHREGIKAREQSDRRIAEQARLARVEDRALLEDIYRELRAMAPGHPEWLTRDLPDGEEDQWQAIRAELADLEQEQT